MVDYPLPLARFSATTVFVGVADDVLRFEPRVYRSVSARMESGARRLRACAELLLPAPVRGPALKPELFPYVNEGTNEIVDVHVLVIGHWGNTQPFLFLSGQSGS